MTMGLKENLKWNARVKLLEQRATFAAEVLDGSHDDLIDGGCIIFDDEEVEVVRALLKGRHLHPPPALSLPARRAMAKLGLE